MTKWGHCNMTEIFGQKKCKMTKMTTWLKINTLNITKRNLKTIPLNVYKLKGSGKNRGILDH
jgi:arsenate reductase-like glutaredoxin family protein